MCSVLETPSQQPRCTNRYELCDAGGGVRTSNENSAARSPKNTEHRSTEEDNNRVGKFNKMERLDPEVQFTEAVTHKMSNKEELFFFPKEIYQERLQKCDSLCFTEQLNSVV